LTDFLYAALTGLLQTFGWPAFGLMLIGIVIGFMVGILPGLGGPTTLALMLPFIFKMSPVEAFAFLLGMAAVTNTTGDITSILFGIPGEPTTAATVVDGHAMAKNGEAGRALGAAIMSSLFGAVFGAVVLAATIPVVRPLVLTFGSPEFFMLSLVGIAFVASLSGGALIKGLLAGTLGLWLATIGLDPVSGTQRYTFGQLFLWDGIGLVPVTIGFFAIPELIDMAIASSSIAKADVGQLGGVWQGVRDTFTHWWLVLRCSAIGTFISIIPGMGAATTQWLAYAHAVQSSPNKERFGKGAVEGVLGPGAANNSTLGGSLVTTVAFGVPASVSTAILMGAFLIQGLVPGPGMLMPAPRGNLAVTFAMVWTIVVSNIITVAICFLFLNQLARITRVRGTLLIPFILTLVYVGAFAEKNVFEDMVVVLAFGVLGWVMAQYGWPRPPLLLGLVLGPLAENKLFLSTDNYGLHWLVRPGVLILAALIVTGVVVPIVNARRRRRASGDAPAATPTTASAGGWRLDGATAFSTVIAAVAAWALWESRHFGPRAGLFPWAVGIPTLGLAMVQLGRDLTGHRPPATRTEEDEGPVDVPPEVVKQRTTSMFLWIGIYLLGIWLIGFSPATLIVSMLYLKIMGERWTPVVVLSLGNFAFVYGLFETGLGVPFPPGQILVWLGLAG
jgi:putative tricarboxylic transport membrane protein